MPPASRNPHPFPPTITLRYPLPIPTFSLQPPTSSPAPPHPASSSAPLTLPPALQYYEMKTYTGGACGCDATTSWQAPRNGPFLTAAGNSVLFQLAGKMCGKGCGTCFSASLACEWPPGAPQGEGDLPPSPPSSHLWRLYFRPYMWCSRTPHPTPPPPTPYPFLSFPFPIPMTKP